MFDPALAAALYDQIAALPTVDAHEHLHAEKLRLARRVDIFLLFYQYVAAELISAGMDPEAVRTLESEEVPLDRKWDSLAPYLDHVRHCACLRPPFEALRRFFGADDLTADNYETLTEQMRAHNQPGLFDRCLREACGIVLVLNQNRTMWQTDLVRPILFETSFIGGPNREGYLEVIREAAGAGLAEDAEEMPPTLSQYLEIMEALLARRQSEGMIGVKSIGFAHVPAERPHALAAYAHMRAGHADAGDSTALASYLRDRLFAACGQLGLVSVQHTGVWAGNFANHSSIRPTNVLPMAVAHPHTRFDLYHAGTPWPMDAALVCRSQPNVWLNLCWSHLLSPVQSALALDEWLDVVPVNKIIGFGGDYWWNVENVYGALKQAREVIAEVLARRLARGSFGEARALRIAKLWLHDNPRELYRV